MYKKIKEYGTNGACTKLNMVISLTLMKDIGIVLAIDNTDYFYSVQDKYTIYLVWATEEIILEATCASLY